MAKPIESIASRLERLVDKSGHCWLWRGSLDRDGYGQVHIGGVGNKKAHRMAWEHANGSIPNGMSVLHRCDNPRCVKPDHLFLGTQTDNRADCVAKNRHSKTPPEVKHGLNHPRCRLTADQVAEIKRLALTMTQRELAARFGVGQTTIWRVKAGIFD